LLGSGEEEVAATDDERRRHRYGERRWVGYSPGPFPRCRRDSDLRGDAADPSDGDAYNDEGGGLRDLEADGPPPPPSWLVCGFCLQERMNKKDK
jgi:hypothetical protein